MADPNQKSVFLAYVALSIGVVGIGFSAIFVKIAGAPGVVSAFYRVLIAGVGIVPWGILRQSKRLWYAKISSGIRNTKKSCQLRADHRVFGGTFLFGKRALGS